MNLRGDANIKSITVYQSPILESCVCGKLRGVISGGVSEGLTPTCMLPTACEVSYQK